MQALATVFGGSGFVGRYAVRALAKAGWRVRVACRHPNSAPELRVMGDVGQIELVQANVRAPDSIGWALDGADACVNLVGVLYEHGLQKFDTVHAEAARDIAQACAARGIERLVHVSALGAAEGSKSHYARTKAEGEAAVRAAAPTATVLRPSVVFGPEDDFFNKFAQMAAVSPVLPLIGGGLTRFQPVYAGDVGAAIAAALAAPEARGRTYELGGPGVYTFKELLALVCKETCRKRALLPLPFPAASVLGLFGDVVGYTPFPPPLTSDQVKLLRADNVVSDAAAGLEALGVTPTALEGVLPTYMWPYRRGGQFAQPLASGA